MKSVVAVLDADNNQRRELCRLLLKHNWKALAFGSFKELYGAVDDYASITVIINLDNIPVDNKRMGKLKMKKALFHIIALSVQPFHPELAESFRENISVCIDNPVEPDELVYWLKTFDP